MTLRPIRVSSMDVNGAARQCPRAASSAPQSSACLRVNAEPGGAEGPTSYELRLTHTFGSELLRLRPFHVLTGLETLKIQSVV